MTHAKELNPQIAAMYLGCEVEWFGEVGYRLAGINTGRSDFNEIGLLIDDGIPVWVNCDEVKLILRPLSDITDEEEREHMKILFPENIKKIAVERYAASVSYLLSRHFDLFGLIDAGLAIDKTVKP